MLRRISRPRRSQRKSSKPRFLSGIIFLVFPFFKTGKLIDIVVGKVEQDGRSVNVRIRDDVSTRNQGVPIALDEFLSKLVKLRNERSLKHSLEKEDIAVAVPNGA